MIRTITTVPIRSTPPLTRLTRLTRLLTTGSPISKANDVDVKVAHAKFPNLFTKLDLGKAGVSTSMLSTICQQ